MYQPQELLKGSLCLPCYRNQKGMYLTCAFIQHPSHLACRLIALDKHPGVRPIVIGDTAHRIIAKAVLSIIGPDIQDVSGCQQLYVVGRSQGSRVPSMLQDLPLNPKTVLLIDATVTWPIEQPKKLLVGVTHYRQFLVLLPGEGKAYTGYVVGG